MHLVLEPTGCNFLQGYTVYVLVEETVLKIILLRAILASIQQLLQCMPPRRFELINLNSNETCRTK